MYSVDNTHKYQSFLEVGSLSSFKYPYKLANAIGNLDKLIFQITHYEAQIGISNIHFLRYMFKFL